MRTSHKLLLIGTLYASEGLPFGFFTQALPVLLRQAGSSLTEIGLTSLLALPWALKFLWAPVVDRYQLPGVGRRRSWIIPMQLLTAAVLAACAFYRPDDNLRVLMIVAALCNLFAATLDVATDGLAVSLLKPAERGIGNGVQVAGYRVGMVISGGALLIVFSTIGWTASFLVMSGLILLFTVPVFLFREPPSAAPARGGWSWQYVGVAGVAPWLCVVFFYKLSEAVGAGMVKPFLVDFGLSIAEIGWLVGTLGFGASLVGALFGGWLTARLGYYRAIILFGTLQALAIATFAVLAAAPDGRALMYVIATFESLVSGMATAAVFTMMMDACRPASEGNDYTVQACVFVIATGFAVGLSGFLADHVGWVLYFSISAVTALCAILPIYLAWRRGGFRALRLNSAKTAIDT